METASGTGRHVQYGFRTVGVNVWSTDVAAFGTVRITAAVPDPFEAWLSGFDFSGFTNPDLSKSGDPDGDGISNLGEFAFDGDPVGGAASGKTRVRLEDVSGERALVLTLPVLEGAVFGGAAAKSATVGGLSYVIEGSNNLVLYDQGVSELSPARSLGLPAASDGWNYHSFRLDGAIGLRGDTGFLRARVSETP
jgi:hypothetical protein